MGQKAVVIGSGIGGLGVACLLGQKGYDVEVIEKNEPIGGLCNTFEEDGFRFDMGPSWYLMPDIFDGFFRLLGEKVSDHLDLVRLSPSYRIYFKDAGQTVDMHSDLNKDIPTFERLEPGSGTRLREYLDRSAFQYDIALKNFLYKNYDTIFDFFNKQTAIDGRKLEVFTRMHDYVSKFFHTEAVQKIMEYQLVFLGSSPYNTPALYNIMAHIDFNMGVFYPRGGIYRIPESLRALAEKRGVRFRTNAPVAAIETQGGMATGVRLESGERITADLVVSNASIHHTETRLLPAKDRTYPESYWEKRTLAPSAFILYLGVRGRIPGLVHHNLVFSKDWSANFAEIFDHPRWPSDPSLYVCAPSVTDPTVAPPNHENLFVLVPTAPGLTATEHELQCYAAKTLETLENVMGIPGLRQRLVYQRIFWGKDFAARYNNYQGTALGLAHTLNQTAIFRPRNQSRKVRNLFYVGANTNPGIGMPICLVSAELAYKRIVGDRSASHLEHL